jgi:hypothetical protein
MQFRTPLVFPLVTIAVLVVTGLAIQPADAVTLGQIDDFEDGSTQLWSEGGRSPKPPTNVASGGPGGADDNYLADKSTGTGTAGSKMVMSNTGRWSGDYISEGIRGIKMAMSNFGDTALQMRIALEGPSGTRYGSTIAFALPADGAWRPVVFGLTEDDLTNLGGVATPNEVLANVGTIRILAASAGPAWKGDSVAASIGIDDIEAISFSVDAKSVSLSALKTSFSQQ